MTVTGEKGQRLQKVLAASGIGSRRKCEEYIVEGRVTVDGKVVKKLGTKADPEKQDIRFNGRQIRAQEKEYWLLNKPKGYICSSKDERSRKTIFALVPEGDARLFSIGRLDRDSEGMIILTNDGDFAQRVGHPKSNIEKTYYVETAGAVNEDALKEMKEGVYLDGARTRVKRYRLMGSSDVQSRLFVGLVEGKNREIRRILAKLGYKVTKLVRIRIGPLKIDGLKPGGIRRLRKDEREKLLSKTIRI